MEPRNTSKVLIINRILTSQRGAAAHNQVEWGRRTQPGRVGAAARNQVRRLSGHGTTALQYQARRLAETLSGSVKGPKRVPLSFRQHPGIKAQGDPLGAVQNGVGVL